MKAASTSVLPIARQPVKDHVPARSVAQQPAAIGLVHDVIQSPGQPLDGSAGQFLSARFGHDFGRIHVHTDARAVESAQALQSRAYTVGQHIVFNQSQYQPQRASGVELIAHELAHTVQQRGAAAGEIGLGTDLGAEQDARAAAGNALLGRPVHLRATPRLSVQRVEFGTYVSNVGAPEYLDAGARFYTTWGYPNVQRVANMQDVLVDLDRSTGPIDKFRIVSHGFGTSLEIGLIPEFDATMFGSTELGFTTEQPFRTQLAAGPKILSDSAFSDWMKVLQKDTTTRPLLDVLGDGSTVPAVASAHGILLRALLETYYLQNVELDTGGAPRFANRGVLDTYNQSRVTTYRSFIVNGTDPAKRADVTKAIDSLAAEIPGAMQRDGRKFNITKSDADTFADPFLDPHSKSKILSRAIGADIREGAGGPFLTHLRSVRKKLSSKSHIEIRGCNIGTSPTFMDQLRGFFGTPGDLPSISAPDLFQYYFQLNFETFTRNPRDEARLQREYTNPDTGLAQGYLQSELVRAKKVAVVVEERTLADIAKSYGVSEATLAKLNPKVDPKSLDPGAILWLVKPGTKTVPVGPFTTLADLCEHSLGNKYIWPAVWGLNPAITDPRHLQPATLVTIPESSPAFTDLLGLLRAGKAEAVIRKDTNRPTVYLDDAHRAQALGDWLAKQKWDPAGRTAAALTQLYAANFGLTGRTFIEFLSRGYPQIEDPIFPDDPRYAAHIIKRP